MKMRRVTITAAAAVAMLVIPAGSLAYGTNSGRPNAVGLAGAGTKLVRFDTERPHKAPHGTKVTGLKGDTSLVGIDRRVQNKRLYGVGNRGGIYLLSSGSAKATKVGQLSIDLDGASFGVDFNPAANALRVISDKGQNLRQPFGTTDAPTGATVVDGALNYLGVTATGVTAAAYTNNDLSMDTATTLFDIDTTLDQVALQSPANSGSLVGTGKLGRNVAANAGFDIFTKVSKGKAVTNRGYATLFSNNKYALYTVNLLTGDLSYKGRFPTKVTDIAITLDK